MTKFDSLSFADDSRPDLEHTIDQLVASANRVLATQGRLRHLLDANRSVVEELDLQQVLLRVVEAAVSLVDAQYGALGVIAQDGHLEQFIHVGIPESDVAAIGPLPEGHGLLGAVIEAAGPIRLEHLARDSRSSGLPEHHPQMEGFLGVPIRVRNEVYGNLYLTNRRDGAFTQEDEDLVTALAATAGVAIDNARLFDESKRRQRWSIVAAEVTSAIAESGATDPWKTVVERMSTIVDADLVCVVMADETSGTRAADDSTPPGNDSTVSGPTLSIPLTMPDGSLGALALSREQGSRTFSTTDIAMASDLVAHATVAIELAHARATSVQLQLVDDRNRIARDLHDHVIQRLFAAGLGLQSLVERSQPELRESLTEQVDAIDAAITDIRTAVFTLGSRSRTGSPSLRSRVLDVVAEITPHLPSTPRLTFGGPVDLTIAGELASDVVAVVREGLSNIARHAHATESSVDVSIVDDAVIVRIEDDGVGIPDPLPRSSGTANLAERATHYGGSLSLSKRMPRGTELVWRTPLLGER
ncbi:MAG: GAF domain-containing protein [Microbacteriaceae bacterium]